MNAIQSSKPQKKSLRNRLIRHINTGLFWSYGLIAGLLVFQCCKLSQQDSSTSILISVGFGLIAAFTFPRIIHLLFWRRFKNEWPDRVAFLFLSISFLLFNYATNVRTGQMDAGWDLAGKLMFWLIMITVGYADRRRLKPPPLSLVLKLADYDGGDEADAKTIRLLQDRFKNFAMTNAECKFDGFDTDGSLFWFYFKGSNLEAVKNAVLSSVADCRFREGSFLEINGREKAPIAA